MRAARWKSSRIRTRRAVKLTITTNSKAKARQVHPGGIRRLAEDPVEPQVAARDRRGRLREKALTHDRHREFKPKTVYVTYIAATPEKVWQALTDPAFTRQYFFGFAIDVEPRTGGRSDLYPDGRIHISGKVIDWSPPRRLSAPGWSKA